MKFNSVEISGFRIYDDPKNATFNFVTEEGETADFVSLLAPNGFGKTSFYDAVEWAVTNNIDRFWVNKNNTEKSLATLRALTSKHIKLLKNNKTTNETWVKILNSKNEEFIKRELNIPGQRASDINRPKDGRDNMDFLKVILSQEWISGFLKEANGQERYKKFMANNSSLQEVDIYYQSVVALSKANKKKVSLLEENIEILESQIDDTIKEDLLGTVNAQIAGINKFPLVDKFSEIKVTTTKKEINDLKNRLSEILADDSQIKELEKLINHISLAKHGDGSHYSQKQFFETKKDLRKLNNAIEEINNNLSDFYKLTATKNELAQKQDLKNVATALFRELIIIQTIVPDYIKIESQISEKNKEKEGEKALLQKLEAQIERSKRSLIEDEEIYKTTERQRLSISQKIKNVPKLKGDIKNLEKTIAVLKKKLETQRKITDSTKKAHSNLETQIDELLKVQQEFKMGHYSEKSLGEDKKQIQNLKHLEKFDALNLKLKKELSELQEKIASQESLNKTIDEFIASGLAIVNQRETDTCPLCEHSYKNYKTLVDKVSNNKALNDSIKDLLQKRTLKNDEIERNRDEKNELIEEIEQYYLNQLDGLQDKIKIANEAKDDAQKLLDESAIELSANNSKLLDLKSQFTEETVDLYEQNLKSELTKAVEKKQTDEKKLVKNNVSTQKLLTEQSQLESTLKLLDEEIDKLKTNAHYSEVYEWYSKNSTDKVKLDDFVAKKIASQQKETTELDGQIKRLQDTEKILNNKLKKHNVEQLNEELKKNLLRKATLESGLESYIDHLKSNLSIDVEKIDNSSLTKKLTTIEQDYQKRLKELSSANIELKKLQGYTENILPFLQSEKAKIDLATFKKDLNFEVNSVGKLLDDEIERTKTHLDKQIKDFFYEELIDEIYGKIDPHPSFKKVRFIATFSDNSPSLDVYVKGSEDDNDEESLIPNLYFSTAQINILSLSIFLASALNSKKYDCIFIDDPIQSMDSINVLSTIDLLRSIVINNKKQIILSTHDKNFHNLLKMKIPTSLFKSKFLELESFGKLKIN
tara:strand:+ start:20622 stop:23753 length:3132 start_codon:yes stop_codon:yes gene_type:complete